MPNSFAEADDDESDDLELIRQAKSGVRDALERLVLRHQAWIYNIAVPMVFDPQDAEDVTQEVLIKAVTRLSTFRGNLSRSSVPQVHGAGQVAAYGRHVTLEGPDVEGVVIAEFPTLEEARAWYDSPEYQEAAKHRHRGSVYRGLIIEGV